MIGNFIADYVKGQKKNDYAPLIRKGIELHRSIDDYTDHHEVTALSKQRLYARHHKYAGVVVDLFYDHFLAKNFGQYSEIPLDEFVSSAYLTFLNNRHVLPEAVSGFLPYMIEYNWLKNYATIEGIGRTLTGLGKRVSFGNRMNEAVIDLVGNYNEFESEFSLFFPQLINFAEEKR